MEKDCLLSVIIPAFNAEKTIARTIESICEQQSEEVEVLVIDDASTDDTVNKLNLTLYKNVKLLRLEENFGQGVARNYGIKKAKGRYISFVDADDWVDPDFINSILAAIKTETEVELFLFGVRVVKTESIQEIECPNVDDILSAFVLDKISCAPWAKINLREIINTQSIRFEDIKPGEDIVFNARFLKHVKKHKIISDIYYNYDCRQPSTTRSIYSFGVIEAHRIANKILALELSDLVDDFKGKNYARSFRYLFMHSMWRMTTDSNLGRLDPRVRKDVEILICSEFRLPAILCLKYLTIKEKIAFCCFCFCRPLAYLMFKSQMRQ